MDNNIFLIFKERDNIVGFRNRIVEALFVHSLQSRLSNLLRIARQAEEMSQADDVVMRSWRRSILAEGVCGWMEWQSFL